MPSLFTPNFHLSRVNGILELHEGAPTPKRSSGHILIIGGGVTGLTTAWALSDAGYQVTVVSEKWADVNDRITSQIAGALWEWPPAVCGKHTNEVSLEKSKGWCMTSYRIFEQLEKLMPGNELPINNGIRMTMANFFFAAALEDMSDPTQLEKWNEIAATRDIRGARRDPELIKRHAVNQKADVVDSYQHMAPIVDTDAYMIWLRFILQCKGVRFQTKRIDGDLLHQEDALIAEYGVNAIVNATGLSASVLASDPTVYPLRGALIRVVNDGKRFPKVKEALAVTHDDNKDNDIVFIVPRNDRILILGGIAQANETTLDLTIDSPEIKLMRERCNHFVPGLENAELAEDPFVQGLRPAREANVRVEREARKRSDGSASRIVHSYGQGGSGFTLSFGCAGDVLGFVQDIQSEAKLRASTALPSGPQHHISQPLQLLSKL